MKKLIFAAALGCFLLASAGATRAQSLADIARKERAKKGSSTKTEKVFTEFAKKFTIKQPKKN